MDEFEGMTEPMEITPATKSSRPPARGLFPRSVILCLSFLLCGLATAYLLFKIVQIADTPGFDFRYIWLAGDMWFDGINPYDSAYEATGAAKINTGHIPIMWVYPPTWWAFATPFGALGLHAANVAWNICGIILVVAICGLAVRSFSAAFPARSQAMEECLGGLFFLPVFSVLFFLMAILEATAILFSVGQTTLIIGFGIALMLWGRVNKSLFPEAVGLMLVMLKPQIGAPFAILLLLLDPRSRKVVAIAFVLSVLLMVPSLVVAPGSILGFLSNLGAYDGFTAANLPQSMTGIRLVVWELAGIDVGNPMASVITLAIVLLLCIGPARIVRATNDDVRAWQIFGLTSAVIVAVAPLHIYDFVLIAVPLALLFRGGWASSVLAVCGSLLIWRSENLAGIWAFHAPEVEIFPGSRLATIGALLFLLAVVNVVLRLNRQDTGRMVSP